MEGRYHHSTMNLCTPLLAAALAFSAVSATAQTTAFTYQGRLTDGNFAANGNYDIRFSLHSVASGAGSVGTSQTINPVVVSSGQFTATLDFGAQFPGADRWLQIEVRPSGSAVAYTVLTPRQRITAAPYASRAASAATSAALTGNITTGQISGGTLAPTLFADNSIAATRLVNDSIGAGQIATGAVGNAELGTGAVTSAKIDPAIGLWSKSGNNIGYTGGNVGIGTTSPGLASLVVNSAVNFNSGLFGLNHPISLQQSHPAVGFNCYYSGSGGILNIHTGGAGNNYAGLLGMDPFTGRFYLDTTSGATANNAAVTRTTRLSILNNGTVGIGTGSPSGALLDVEGTVRLNNNDLYLRGGTDNNHGLGWYGSGKLWGPHDVDGPVLYGWNGGVLGTPPDKVALSWSWDGYVRVGSDERSGTFDVTTSTDKSIRFTNDGFVPGIQGVSSTAGDAYAGYLRVRHVMELWPKPDGSAAAKLDVRDASGNATIVLDGGNGEATMKALNLTGGSDVAEPIPMDEDVPPGAAVVIDADRPGEVKMSAAAYDTGVAGIVSGANGVKPGLSLRQEGVLDGGKNVALTGRVYALADAESSPIKPGDLLVTSDVPGHVMKAADRERSHGAILGKAMTPLGSGRGMVLVLVNLQ
jgi:hypothetical protein